MYLKQNILEPTKCEEQNTPLTLLYTLLCGSNLSVQHLDAMVTGTKESH